MYGEADLLRFRCRNTQHCLLRISSLRLEILLQEHLLVFDFAPVLNFQGSKNIENMITTKTIVQRAAKSLFSLLIRNLAGLYVPDSENSCAISLLIINPEITTNIYSKKSSDKYNFGMIENYENHGYCSKPLNVEPMDRSVFTRFLIDG